MMMWGWRVFSSALYTILFAFAAAGPTAVAQTSYPPYVVLNDLNGTINSDIDRQVTDISADGRVVVGFARRSETFRREAWRWEEGVGFSFLGYLPPPPPPAIQDSVARFASANGVAATGHAGNRSFRWTANDGMTDLLASLPTNITVGSAYPVGISANGNVVVGYMQYTVANIQRNRGFRWTTNAFSFLTGPTNSDASVNAFSLDGVTAVGNTQASLQMCRWSNTTVILMGNLPGATYTFPMAVSSNGQVIAGYAQVVAEVSNPLFVWTPAGGFTAPVMPSGANAVSELHVTDDGTKVFGNLYFGNSGGDTADGEPFVWTAENGIQRLGVPAGMRWAWMKAASRDGSTVIAHAGTGMLRTYPFEPDVRHYYWTAAKGWRPIAQPDEQAVAQDVSADGMYSAGMMITPGGSTWKPVRWTLSSLSSPSIADGVAGITNDLPDATNRQNYAYSFTLDGTPQPTVALLSGSLPGGLELTPSGVITGAPTEFGVFTFTVRATNSVPPAAEKTFRLRILPRVTMLGVEMNQSLQNLPNEIRLVQGKRTIARVHVESPDATSGDLIVEGVLHGRTQADVPLPGSPLLPRSGLVNGAFAVTNLGIVEATSLDATLNFELPSSWTRQNIIVRPELKHVAQTNADFGFGSDPDKDGEVWVFFDDPTYINLHFVPVTMDNDTPSNRPPDADQLMLDALLLEFTFPVSKVNATIEPGIRFDSNNITNTLDLWKLLSAMGLHWALTDKPARDLYYGSFNSSKNLGGLASSHDNTTSVAAGQYYPGFSDLFFHELGHLLGRPHAASSNLFGYGQCGAFTNEFGIRGACGECVDVEDYTPYGYYHTNAAGLVFAGLDRPTDNRLSVVRGLNTLSQNLDVYPHNQAVELMSYCNSVIPEYKRWPSRETYQSLYFSIATRFPIPAPNTRRSKAGEVGVLSAPGTPYVVVRGLIEMNTGEVELQNLHRVQRTHPIEPATTGAYTLDLRNAADVLLVSYPFDPSDGSEGTLIVQPFLVVVPDHPDLRRVTVRKSSDVKDEIAASPNAPTVIVLSPNGGESFAGPTIPVSWAGTDSDGDPLTYTIFFSADGGATWAPVGIDIEGESYEIPRDYVPGTTQGLIRVVAGDGFWTTADESDAVFSTAFHPPVVRLIAGNPGEPIRAGATAWFQVAAYDIEDGMLSESNLVWSSDLDGVFATGTMVDTAWSNRSLGVHAITVTATDSHGMTATNRFPVEVVPIRPALIQSVRRASNQVVTIKGFAESPNELVVESSTNMANWHPVYTAMQEQAIFTITDFIATNRPTESYRVITRPPNLP
ncbi:MAG TPA: putative Ig domain-containing protein [Kiritimatiellia bacterium]|nr:putative Ig domain-containing protein [Kiritimatiellia bacterium]